MKKGFAVFFLFVFCIFSVCLAESLRDSLGVMGKLVFDTIERSPLGGNGAMLICMIIGFMINRFGQILLKALPTTGKINAFGKLTIPLFWKLLTFLWGASIDKYNLIIKDESSYKTSYIVKSQLKEHISKHKGIFKYL